MKKFFKYFGLTILITCLLAVVANFLIFSFFRYYQHRTKMDVKNQDAEVVFFGSSRCVHNVIPKEFDSLSRTSSYNMGWSAVNPREIYAAIKIYLSQNEQPAYIFIQLDNEHDIVKPDELARQSLLKFYHTGLIDDYFTPELKKQLSVPLLPSILYRDFGWREMIKATVNNADASVKTRGYVPDPWLMDTSRIIIVSPDSSMFRSKNPWIQKAITLCDQRNIKVILFTSPYYRIRNAEYFDRFRMYGKPYFNFSRAISDQALFSDNSHINHQGAQVFTTMLSEAFRKLVR